MTSIEHLRAFAKPLGVRLLLENIPNELCHARTHDRVLARMSLRRCRSLLRRGHAPHDGRYPPSIRDLEGSHSIDPRPRQRKDKDSHLWPGKGSIDWKQTMELLRTAPHTPPVAAGNRRGREEEFRRRRERNISKAGKFVENQTAECAEAAGIAEQLVSTV